MSVLKTHFEIFSQAHTTILTPNRRLAATLHKLYQAQQLERQNNFWPTPDILPITTWVGRLWQEYTSKDLAAKPFLLTTAQEQWLWENVILNHTNKPLLRLIETAELARTAWRLLKEWQINLNHPAFKTTEDYAALHRWMHEYQKICHDKNYIDSTLLTDLITEKIDSQSILPAKQIILLGFNEISPQFQRLLASCHDQGTSWRMLQLIDSIKPNCQRINLRDAETEMINIAWWVKAKLAENPNASIGCVFPSLDKIRDRVAQIFSEVFADKSTSQQFFNISAGKSLLLYPIINTALQLLSLYKQTIKSETLCYLLASPFLGAAEKERTARANFDKLLRQKNIKKINFCDAHSLTFCKVNIPFFTARLERALALISHEKILSYHGWAQVFNQFLTELGWPGERSLISEEYQTVENWLKLFNDFSSLDQIAPPATFYQALQALHKITQSRTFQPKTPDAPIQVLGILEAAALPFDYLWVAGMDDASWPPQPKPHPFIPKNLQRELHMPHATAERELIYCRELTQQFMQSASQVIFSHADKKDELILQVSPLIQHLPLLPQPKPHVALSERIFQSKQLAKIQDELGPPLSEKDNIRGGMSVLKYQALCPFKAFAEWRLHAHELENCIPGLRAKDRGNILHKALELLWLELKDQSALTALSEAEINELISRNIHHAFNAFPYIQIEQEKYLSLEKLRLSKLLHEWLLIEKQRAPFKVISNEKTTEISLQQLKLALRIDRIDELENGDKLIIDYKTGKYNDIKDWFDERPSEPQLPLYSLVDPVNTSALAFAQLVPGEICFKGISRNALDIKGIKFIEEMRPEHKWAEQLSKWQTILLKLSDDFCQGIASVDPKQPPETCNWCALQSLCRVNDEMD